MGEKTTITEEKGRKHLLRRDRQEGGDEGGRRKRIERPARGKGWFDEEIESLGVSSEVS